MYGNVISVNTYFITWRSSKTAFVATPSFKCTSPWGHSTLCIICWKLANDGIVFDV